MSLNKSLSVVFVLNLVFTITSHAADLCQSYLNQPSKTDSKTLAVVAKTYPDLSKRQRTMLLARTERTTLEALEQDYLIELMELEIIHSKFFKATYDSVSWITSPAQLALFTPQEVQQLAVRIYQRMDRSFEDKDAGIKALSNVVKARELFMKLPSEYVIDKIGEALTLTGVKGKFLRYQEEINSRAEIFQLYGVIVPITGTVISFVTALFTGVSYNDPLYWSTSTSYSTGLATTAINYYSTGILGVSLSALPVAFQSTRIGRYLTSRKFTRSHNEISGNTAELEPYTRLALFSDTSPGELSGRIKEIDAKIPDEISSDQNLMTFGSELTSLNKELTRVFVNDFMSWMVVYKENIETSKQRLLALKDGKVSNSSAIKDPLSTLSNIFVEAGEATRQTNITSQKILRKLNEALQVLNDMDQSDFNDFDKMDWARKSEHLRQTLAIHSNFRTYLSQVYRTISDVLASLDSMNLAEAAVYVNRMGNQLKNNLEVVQQIELVLASLDKFEQQFESLVEVIN